MYVFSSLITKKTKSTKLWLIANTSITKKLIIYIHEEIYMKANWSSKMSVRKYNYLILLKLNKKYKRRNREKKKEKRKEKAAAYLHLNVE